MKPLFLFALMILCPIVESLSPYDPAYQNVGVFVDGRRVAYPRSMSFSYEEAGIDDTVDLGAVKENIDLASFPSNILCEFRYRNIDNVDGVVVIGEGASDSVRFVYPLACENPAAVYVNGEELSFSNESVCLSDDGGVSVIEIKVPKAAFLDKGRICYHTGNGAVRTLVSFKKKNGFIKITIQ